MLGRSKGPAGCNHCWIRIRTHRQVPSHIVESSRQEMAITKFRGVKTKPASANRSNHLSLNSGCSKRPSSKAAGESKPEAYPLGYVEDFDEPRTKLEAVFNILLVLEDFRFRIRRLHRNLRLRIPFIKHQHIPDRHDPDNFTFLGHSKMPHT